MVAQGPPFSTATGQLISERGGADDKTRVTEQPDIHTFLDVNPVSTAAAPGDERVCVLLRCVAFQASTHNMREYGLYGDDDDF